MLNIRNRTAYILSKKISNAMNEVNNNVFTKWEVKESIKCYMLMLLYNDKQQLIDMLQSEIIDGNVEMFTLYNEVILF